MKAISSLHERFPVLAARGALTHSVSYGPRFFVAGFLTVAAKCSQLSYEVFSNGFPREN